MNADVVILAGGYGKRLQTVVNDVPKPMAPVNGKPFLEYILQNLVKQNIQRVILSIGYKSDTIKQYFQHKYGNLDIEYVEEFEPLGTGGGIMNAISACRHENIFVLNGDTYFNVDLHELLIFHKEKKADITLCLKSMPETQRYGTVEVNEAFRIVRFTEKGMNSGNGYINAGIYLFNKNVLTNSNFPKAFSVEKDLFEKKLDELQIIGKPQDAYFIDIGIPEDYTKANEDFKTIC